MMSGKWYLVINVLFLWIHLSWAFFNLTILHTNDVHSHFEEFNVYGGRCTPDLASKGECYGGFPRQVTKAREIRAKEKNLLYINAGDFYQGSIWFSVHRWLVTADLVNYLGLDAMSLGNHEFDDGLTGLIPFLDSVKTKVIVCNINSSRVPKFQQFVKPSLVMEIGGEKIGIIGYLTPETVLLSSPGDLIFEEEVECISREAKRLIDEENINKIIAVGHSGFEKDKEIASKVPEVDIVVGGHTNTFLYTGDPPSVEEPQGPYPVVIERPDGSKGLVVQDYAFGKYLGFLRVVFDENGEVTSWKGNPILLDYPTPQDNDTLEALNSYQEEVKEKANEVVGFTKVLLKGERLVCRMKECNLGNFLTDASVEYFIEDRGNFTGWTGVAIALWNSGGIRSSIDERFNQGNITLGDVMTVAPFGNTLDVVDLRGETLREILEHSVKNYDTAAFDPPGAFLQVSGLRVVYNISMPKGERVAEVSALCNKCRVPKFLPLDDNEVYSIVMPTYMTKGGDGYGMIPGNIVAIENTNALDIDVIVKYMKRRVPITTGLEDRIVVIIEEENETSTTPPSL